MTATMNPPQRIGSTPGAGTIYRLTWSSDQEDPTYDLYELSGGGFLYHGPAESFEVSVPAGSSPVYWITDDGSEPDAAYPARFTLQWLAVDGAQEYKVEEYVSAAWTQRATVRDDGSWCYRWLTRFLEDVTEHQFRVMAIGSDGNESSATSVMALMIRYPDVPNVSYAYDETTRQVTISAD